MICLGDQWCCCGSCPLSPILMFGGLSLSLHPPIWTQERIIVKSPDHAGLLPSDSELFPWTILMPHLHLGIGKGKRSLTLKQQACSSEEYLREGLPNVQLLSAACSPQISHALSVLEKKGMTQEATKTLDVIQQSSMWPYKRSYSSSSVGYKTISKFIQYCKQPDTLLAAVRRGGSAKCTQLGGSFDILLRGIAFFISDQATAVVMTSYLLQQFHIIIFSCYLVYQRLGYYCFYQAAISLLKFMLRRMTGSWLIFLVRWGNRSHHF